MTTRPRTALIVISALSVFSIALAACGAAPAPATRPTAQAAPTTAPAQALHPTIIEPTAAAAATTAPTMAAAATTAPTMAAAATTAPTMAAAATTAPTMAAAATTAPTMAAAAAPTSAATAAPAAPGAFSPRQPGAALTLSGASAGALTPLLDRWTSAYKDLAKNLTIDAQNAPSDQVLSDFVSGKDTFAAVDMPLSDEQLKQAPDALHVPIALDAVAIAYNLKGVSELKLSPATLAGIFAGTITKWNDPQIVADNPDLKLPDTAITVVHRSDSSGTTDALTSYLSAVDKGWNMDVGMGAGVQWPAGSGAAQDAGVAEMIGKTDGAIGYLALSYALAQDQAQSLAMIKNAAGQFVAPSLASVAEAANATLADVPSDLRLSIVNPAAGESAYPISHYTWALVHGTMQDKGQAEALTDFLYWALTEGVPADGQPPFTPLPSEIQQRAIAQLGKVMVDGQPAFTPPAGK